MPQPEAHALFTSQMMVTLMNSFVMTGYVTAEQANQLVTMTLDHQKARNPALVADFDEIAAFYREGIAAMQGSGLAFPTV